MKRIIRSRGYGKTYDLIKYALENGASIITSTEVRAKHIRDMSKRYFGKEVWVYSATEWRKMVNHSTPFDDYVIDELETVAQTLLEGNMIGWNMSME
jgi:predicted NodU family carbamoyl transferase